MENKQKTRLDVLVEFTGIEKEKFSTRESNMSKGEVEVDENSTEFEVKMDDGEKFSREVYYCVLATEDEEEDRLKELLHDTVDPEEQIERFGSDDEDEMDVSDECLNDYLGFEGELHGYKIYSA
jgi:hypothetical protein